MCKFVIYKKKEKHKVRTILFQSFDIPKLIQKYDIDLLFYPTFSSGYYLNIGIPVVVTPHDIQFKFYPENFSILQRWYLNFGYKHSLKTADRIIAISNYVKDTLKRYYAKECKDKIKTIYNPIEFNYGKEVKIDNVSCPFILTVSTIAKHKNMITLLKAYKILEDKILHKLVIVGCHGNGIEEINEYIKNNELKERVIITGFISNEQINWLYNHADLYVTTSLYEGFGMTPIEAMGRGIKTITSKETSLPEVTLNLADYYEPACDEKILAQKIFEVIKRNIIINYKEIFYDAYNVNMIARKYFDEFRCVYSKGSCVKDRGNDNEYYSF